MIDVPPVFFDRLLCSSVGANNERESDWYLVSSEQDAMQVQLVTNRLRGQRFVLLVAAIFRLSSGH